MPREMNLEAVRKRFEGAEWSRDDFEWMYSRAQRAYWLGVELEKLWDHVMSCPKCGTKIKLQEMRHSDVFTAIRSHEVKP